MLVLAFHAGLAHAAPVERITLSLDVTQRRTASGIDSTFVPFSTQLAIVFDAGWLHTDVYPNVIEVVFAGNTRFESPLTSLLPWVPPPELPPGQQLAVFDDVAHVYGLMYWHVSYGLDDASARRSYRYGVSLNSNPGAQGQYVPMIESFRTGELLAFLDGLRTSATPMQFDELATIYDTGASAYTGYADYSGDARIVAIAPVGEAGSTTQVPLPGTGLAALALASLGARALVRRR